MKFGLAGYSGSGVTTLLALFSGDTELAGRHAGPEIRSVILEDDRLAALVEMFEPAKVTPVHLDLVELGDLRPEDGGGLRKDTLSRAAGLEALAIVLRGFEAPMNPGGRPEVEILDEMATLREEFCFTDLVPVENRLERLSKEGKLASPEARLLERIRDHLEEGLPIRSMELTPEDRKAVSGYQFMTLLPLLYVVNKGEDDTGKLTYPSVKERCRSEGLASMEVCALSELELLDLSEEDRGPFLEELGLKRLSRDVFVEAAFDQLSLLTFFTVSEKEVRGWTLRSGTPAARAAGKIHTDMERGFIRGEVIHWEELVALGGLNQAKDAGKLRLEGKEYIVKDGEIFHVRFNV
jgi:ribosome-binding ATPase YchF (GTP1/OBG family)